MLIKYTVITERWKQCRMGKKCYTILVLYVGLSLLLITQYLKKDTIRSNKIRKNSSVGLYNHSHWSIETHKKQVNKVQLLHSTNKRVFKILYWTDSYYSKSNKWFGLGSEPFKACHYSNCLATNKRDAVTKSDAVLFHLIFTNINKMPAYRQPYQKWIMHTGESPSIARDYTVYNGLFNATWTYERSSDIWTNYSHRAGVDGGLFVKRAIANINLLQRNYGKEKEKLAVWLVSHCDTESRRMEYVEHLQQYIKVDIFGSCGDHSCGHKKQSQTCNVQIGKAYKFYLAFENRLCDDYVTEKLWRAIHHNMVPIVLGAYNYSELLPPQSYIDIKDFKSPKDLAEYLIKLDMDDNLYNGYLSWKAYYDIVGHPEIQCTLCEYLNVAEDSGKTYDNIGKFWGYNQKCYSPETYYKTIIKSTWNKIA